MKNNNIKLRALFVAIAMLAFACNNSKNINSEKKELEEEIIIEKELNQESYVEIEKSIIDILNKKILETNTCNEEEIMHIYRPITNYSEGNYSYNISVEHINEETKEITLIEEGINDDSVFGVKVLMTVKIDNNNCKVISIKENYKCWKNRGSQTWSAELCK